MTVSTTTNKIVLTADGFTNTFSFPFAVRANGQSDIQVFTTVSGVITQLTFNTQYTVTLNAAIAPNPTPIGGSVNIPSTPANGTLVTILRTMSLTQPTSLANQGTLYQPVLESVDDNQTMQSQQISELQGRAIVVAVSDNAPTALPPAAQRANLAMGFDASGNPTAIATLPAGTVSSAMAPFVASASIAAAKALLGYGTMANENIGAAGKGIVDDGAGNALVKHLISAVSAGQSPTSANHMTDYVSSGTLVHTLPKLTTVFNGYELWWFCIAGTATLSPNAADNFPGAAGGAAIVLTVGQFARIIGDGTSAWQVAVGRIPGIGGATVQRKTSGSGTYTTPAGCIRLRVRMVGGGASGGVTGTGNGNDGAQSSFGATTANGGSKGTTSGGAGGTGGTTSGTGFVEILRRDGGAGQDGVIMAGANAINIRTVGGSTLLSAGVGNGSAPPTNSGAGSAGFGSVSGGAQSGGGGGGGESVEFFVNNPAASYAFVVGAAGATAGGAGAAGAAGVIIVEEFYA